MAPGYDGGEPLAQLRRVEKEWRGIWSKGRPCVSSSNVEVRQEEPITVERLKAACKTFEFGTAVGTDGVRPRHLTSPSLAYRFWWVS